MQQSSNPTRLCEIVVVIIRILAIKLALDALSYLLAQYPRDLHPKFGLILFGIVAFCAYWLWQFSPFFARHITRGQDSTLDCGSLGSLRSLHLRLFACRPLFRSRCLWPFSLVVSLFLASEFFLRGALAATANQLLHAVQIPGEAIPWPCAHLQRSQVRNQTHQTPG